jgi:hypothetical protein
MIHITTVTDAQAEIEIAQKAFCRERGLAYVPAPPTVNSGLALSTKGRKPINGLRHSPEHGTTGWYIWSGEDFSNSPDFFAPIHTGHIYDDYPELVKLLGLPPGYRFLLAGDYLDVWYDATLLNL